MLRTPQKPISQPTPLTVERKRRVSTCHIKILLVLLCGKDWGMLDGVRATAALGLDGLVVGVP